MTTHLILKFKHESAFLCRETFELLVAGQWCPRVGTRWWVFNPGTCVRVPLTELTRFKIEAVTHD